MIDYIIRAIKQIKRFKGRNLTILIGLIIMVSITTILLTLSVQLGSFFEQGNLEQLKKYQYFETVPFKGKEVNERSVDQIKEIDGVESVLPLIGGFIRYSELSFKMDDYQILPLYISYYDSDYYSEFFKGDIMVDYLPDSPGIIVSSSIRNYMLPQDEYNELFGVDDSTSTEQMSASLSRTIKRYRDEDLPISKEQLNIQLVGKEIQIYSDNKYESDKENSSSTFKISGEMKDDYVWNGKYRILVPGNQKGKIPGLSYSKPQYTKLYIKAESLDDVIKLEDQLKEMGYYITSDLSTVKRSFKVQQETLNNLLILMGIILIIGVIGYINTMQSSIQERRNEFALMKALGATSSQITLGIVLEGIILALIAVAAAFTITTILFKIISYMINTEIISASYFLAFNLEKESVLYMMNIPPTVYISVLVGTLIVGFILSYLPAKHFFKQDYLSLMKRG